MIQFVQKNPRLTALVTAWVLITTVFTAAQAQSVATGEGVATGHQGMVATAHPLASEAAIEILKRGGNAVDAAVAAAFAVGVVEPDGSGIGGGGGMVIYLNGPKIAHYIDYYQSAPQRVGEMSFDSEADRHTAKAVLIPGEVAGLVTALEKFGTLPLPVVLEPAIRYARDGFEIDGTLARLILDNADWLAEMGPAGDVFLEDGFPRMEGDLLVQAELAETLTLVARNGRDGFYSGPVAEAIVRELQAGGGVISVEDMAARDAEVLEPLKGTYRGFTVLSANAPQSGSTVIEILNMLEYVDLGAMGHYSESAPTLHIMAESFRRAYADRFSFMGDPHMTVVPVRGLISKALAWERFNDINQYRAEPANYRSTAPGNPFRYNRVEDATAKVAKEHSAEEAWDDSDDDGKSSYDSWGEDLFDSYGAKKHKAKKANKPVKGSADSTFDDDNDLDEEEFDGHTTHLSVIDKDGNAVSLSQTLGTFFGSGQMIKGVLLNCSMTNYSTTSDPNLARPGSIPRSSISPTIVLHDDEPFLVVGSPGAGRIICTVVEVLVNMIDFGMDVLEANLAPRFYCQKFEDNLHLEAGISEDVEKKLEAMGHPVRTYAAPDLFFGGVQAIQVDTLTGVYYGSADPRRGGRAIGY